MPDAGRPPDLAPRQRWRILFRRDEDARFLAHLDAMKLWERALRRAGIPVAQTEGMSPRPRIVFAAPLPLGMLAEREIVDVVLSRRLTVADLRDRLSLALPDGFGLVDLYDVWLHAPSVASQLAGAAYRMEVTGTAPAPVRADALRAGVATLLASDRLDRTRQKEKRSVRYDLRPLIMGIDVPAWDDAGADGAGSGTLRIDVRHSQEEGTGRPDEVVAALGETVGGGLVVTRGTRERLMLVDGAD
ncbi:MAG: TIGR03936 family radical SAM-associated protein [Chloroflexi bacterium]|jgi:radical SAM-linked protein|nr:TIGR03936 family radical SAM-associated protein [Chloroflexota bacterium]